MLSTPFPTAAGRCPGALCPAHAQVTTKLNTTTTCSCFIFETTNYYHLLLLVVRRPLLDGFTLPLILPFCLWLVKRRPSRASFCRPLPQVVGRSSLQCILRCRPTKAGPRRSSSASRPRPALCCPATRWPSSSDTLNEYLYNLVKLLLLYFATYL